MSRDGCKFLSIKDAMQCLNRKTNIIGLILDYGIPKWSKGTGGISEYGLKLEDEGTRPLPLQIESLSLSRDTLSLLPSAGSILRVITNLGHEKLEVRFLKSGKWMRFTNLLCEVHTGLWYGVFLPSSKPRYVLNGDNVPLQRQRSYEKRISFKYGRQVLSIYPSHPHITVTDHRQAPFSTLMGILSHSKVTDKFRCAVRVVAMYPWRVEDFKSPHGIYRIRLTLEDATARIHAFIYAEDGEKFFGGHPPLDTLKKKRNRLLGVNERSSDEAVNEGPRNPPWIGCCLKSYYLDKTDVWGSRNYRIFDTRILEDASF